MFHRSRPNIAMFDFNKGRPPSTHYIMFDRTTSCLELNIVYMVFSLFLSSSSPATPKIMGVSGHDNTVKMAAEVGTEVVLPCEAEGSPSPLLTWSRNGHPIPPVTAG